MSAIKLTSINQLGDQFKIDDDNDMMPTLFIGHGSPMNALASNDFTRSLSSLGENLKRPKAILCISAHWMTKGTWITQMEEPKTIHDFFGFPKQLFDVEYPAPGSPHLALDIKKDVTFANVQLDDHEWGLDHGTWSVLKFLYPKADVPVLQMSLDVTQGPEYHYKLGQELSKLRQRGVLILGSGNIVHNLRTIDWDEKARPYDWAIEFDEYVKDKLIERDIRALQNDFLQTEAGRLSVPSMDHYYPLLYILGASKTRDELKFEYEEIQNASISMRAFSFSC